MATITVEKVREIINTDLPVYIIQALIDQMDAADTCFEGLGLTDDQIKTAKMLGVLHVITLIQRGGVSGESTKTGASRNYFSADSINSTPHGIALQSVSGGQCILNVTGSDSRVYMMSIKTPKKSKC